MTVVSLQECQNHCHTLGCSVLDMPEITSRIDLLTLCKLQSICCAPTSAREATYSEREPLCTPDKRTPQLNFMNHGSVCGRGCRIDRPSAHPCGGRQRRGLSQIHPSYGLSPTAKAASVSSSRSSSSSSSFSAASCSTSISVWIGGRRRVCWRP